MTTFRTRFITACIVILIFVSNNYAQDIEQKSQDFPVLHSLKDTINLYIKRGDSLSALRENADAKVNYIKAFQLARKRSDKKRLLKSGIKIVYASVELNQFDEAQETLSFIDSYCKKIKDTTCLVEVKKRYGGIYHKMGNYKKALTVFNQGFDMIKNVDDDALHHNLFLARAYLLFNIENFKGAKNDYQNALKYIDHKKDILKKINIYTGLVGIYGDLGKIDSSYYYFQESVKLCGIEPDIVNCFTIYNNMAYTYLQNGEPQKGLDIIDNNIDLKNLDRFKQHGVYGAFMHTMGALYYEVGEYKKAINYYKTSLKFDTKHNDINAILRTKEDLSKVYET